MGNTGERATRKASHPGSPSGSFVPSFTTGRSHAARWSSQAHEIKRFGLFIKIPRIIHHDLIAVSGVTDHRAGACFEACALVWSSPDKSSPEELPVLLRN